MALGVRYAALLLAAGLAGGCADPDVASNEPLVIATGKIDAANRCSDPCDNVRMSLRLFPANHQMASFFDDQLVTEADEGRRFRATVDTDDDFLWAVRLLTNGEEDRVQVMVLVGPSGAGNGLSEADLFALTTVDLKSEQIDWIDLVLESLSFTPTGVAGEMLVETTARIEVGRTT
ncbi:MAG: hypothetical protein DHS20C21_19640 [Gemmatimonadota bacterium]|nr:MAG: hypothetical protein DHS20C21_19640 [Gemmatimonadota bacterium]